MYLFFAKGLKVENLKKPAIQRDIVPSLSCSFASIPLFDGGKGAELLVGEGDKILRYDKLARRREGGYVYSPFSGIVSGFRVIDHPFVGRVTCVDIAVSKKVEKRKLDKPGKDQHSPEELTEIAKNAGIVDEYDGIPLYRKLQIFARDKVSMVVADAIDDEPYVSSGMAVFAENRDQVLRGLHLVQEACPGSNAAVTVMAPFGIRKIRRIPSRIGEIPVSKITGKYPVWVGLEKMVSPYGKPIGKVGVQACAAFAQAVDNAEPQLDCVVTGSGDAVKSKRNIRVAVGTPVEELLKFCGLNQEPSRLVMGNSMTGVSLTDISVPVVVGSRCVLAMAQKMGPRPYTCIGCGRCNDACSAGILPGTIAKFVERGDMENVKRYGVDRCNGCGACSAVCPARLELAEMMNSLMQGSPVELFEREVR